MKMKDSVIDQNIQLLIRKKKTDNKIIMKVKV